MSNYSSNASQVGITGPKKKLFSQFIKQPIADNQASKMLNKNFLTNLMIGQQHSATS